MHINGYVYVHEQAKIEMKKKKYIFLHIFSLASIRVNNNNKKWIRFTIYLNNDAEK